MVSPNLMDDVDAPCLPALARSLNGYLDWLYPQGTDERNVVFEVGQGLFTPADRERKDLIADDRPYAAVLAFSLGYNVRRGDELESVLLRLGIVGPSAFGRQVQNDWHDLIGNKRFEGWDNQLHDEPIFQFVHEHRQRAAARSLGAGWAWDSFWHWGASLGNFATYANAGLEWRIGYHLPHDFGSSPARLAGEGISPGRTPPNPSGWAAHAFVSLDGRWVLRDITLDGNTFRSSRRVDKRPMVGDLGYGMAVTHGRWRFAFARYHRTREFEGQKEVPVYGSVSIGRQF